jgi:cell wall assembly regulator SMI1
MDVEKAWTRLKDALENYAPERLSSLNPGATLQEIIKAEDYLGIKFPESYRKFLMVHNGEKNRGWKVSIFGGPWGLLSLKDLVKQWNMWEQFRQDGTMDKFVLDHLKNDKDKTCMGTQKMDTYSHRWMW